MLAKALLVVVVAPVAAIAVATGWLWMFGLSEKSADRIARLFS